MLSSKPAWTSGSESMQAQVTFFKLGNDSLIPKLKLPRREPIDDGDTLTFCPFHTTDLTELGANISDVVVAFRSPFSESVDP